MARNAGRKVRVRDGSGDPREYVLGPEVDLDTEVVLDSRGRRIDEAYAKAAAADALAKVGRGRPSLTAPGHVSPKIEFRVTPQLRQKVEARAAAEGRRVSDIAREALERYVG
jgi:hypothetical protein